MLKIQLFHGDGIRLQVLQKLGHIKINFLQPLLKKRVRLRGDSAVLHRAERAAHIIQRAKAHNGIARVYPKDAHVFCPPLAAQAA